MEEDKAKAKPAEEETKQAAADRVLEDAKQEPSKREAADEALVTKDAAQYEAPEE